MSFSFDFDPISDKNALELRRLSEAYETDSEKAIEAFS